MKCAFNSSTLTAESNAVALKNSIKYWKHLQTRVLMGPEPRLRSRQVIAVLDHPPPTPHHTDSSLPFPFLPSFPLWAQFWVSTPKEVKRAMDAAVGGGGELSLKGRVLIYDPYHPKKEMALSPIV